MKRIQQISHLALVGTLLMLAIIMPVILQSAGPRDDNGRENGAPPRVASDPDYLYTIGVTGVSGSDNAHFYYPYGVAVNSTGHLYVGDRLNDRVQVFDKTGTYLYTIGASQFDGASDVAINTTNYLYVADQYNYCIQVFDSAGTYQYTIGTTGSPGSGNYQFEAPPRIAVNTTGHLYVADLGNHRVQVFDNGGNYQYTIGVTGVSGSDNAHFYYPYGVAVNSTGHLYVVDQGNHRVQVFDNAGNYQYTIGVTGVSGSDNAHFASPSGIMMNTTGHAYIADSGNHRVQVFSNAGIYQYTIGVTGVSGSDNAHLNYPTMVAMNATGHLYVADAHNHRIQVFNNGTQTNPLPPTGLIITIDGGAGETGSTSVTLTLSATGATEMCFSNNGTTFTDWEAYGTSKAWTLDEVPGLRIVYFKARNGTIEAAAPVTDDILYVAPPSSLSISINDGATETGSTSVTLTLSATGATEMCFSNDGVTWSAWESFVTTKTWTLAGGGGTKTVYLKARNGTIEAVAPATDSITYKPPSGDGEGIPGYPLVVLLAVTGLGILSLWRRLRPASRA